MRKILLTLCVLTSLALNAQTTLPTSWDFVSTPATLPTGWSTNTTSSYTSGLQDLNGTSSKAGKLQATDHEFVIHFFDEPGTVTYNIKSYGTPQFAGTFVVQESVNGTTWTALETYNTGDFTDQWTQYTETPNVNSRYIRFLLTNKISGTNVGLDDVTIAANVPTQQEINVTFQGNDVPSGTGVQFASAVGTPLALNFDVENLGTGSALTISGASVSGTAASDYTVTTTPTSVGTSSSETLTVTFNPTVNGSRVATLSISNDDANENPYTIVLNGIGGTGASEPASNPSAMNTPVLKTYRIKGQMQAVTCDGYLVLFRKGQDFTDLPVDNTSYEVGEGLGDAKVAYIGPNSFFFIKEAEANTNFYVKVFAYNGNGQFINYKQSNPLEETITTPIESMMDDNYYNGVEETNSSFISDLHDVINPHMVRFYSNYDDDFVPLFYQRDTTNGDGVLTGVYSGNNVIFTPPFSWPGSGMNREHTLPASWMPTVGNSNTPEYQDYHHLFPTVSTANSQRSNHPLGNVVNVTNSYGAGVVGTDNSGNTVYEPRDAHKGDAARAIFYMQTAYHGESGNSWAFDDLNSDGPDQKQAVLKEWHINDLPSGFDRARNDFLDSLQQNRNPFTDSAHWVCHIDFKTMSYIATPDSSCLQATMYQEEPVDTTDTTNSIATVFDKNWIFYPNPATDYINVGYLGSNSTSILIYNMQGALIKEDQLMAIEKVDLSYLSSGLYLVTLKNHETEKSQSFRLVKQ